MLFERLPCDRAASLPFCRNQCARTLGNLPLGLPQPYPHDAAGFRGLSASAKDKRPDERDRSTAFVQRQALSAQEERRLSRGRSAAGRSLAAPARSEFFTR